IECTVTNAPLCMHISNSERSIDHLEGALKKATKKRAFWPVAIVTAGGFAWFFIGLVQTDFGKMGAATLIYVPGFLILFRLIWLSAGGTRVVVWLRRFHKREQSRFPLPSLFRRVGFASFQVATIQDTRFKYSFFTGVSKYPIITYFVLLLVATPLVVVAFALAAKIVGIDGRQEPSMWLYMDSALLSVPISWIIVYPPIGLIIYLLARWRGTERLRASTLQRRILRWTNRIKGGKAPPIVGMKVFKCDDSCWRDAVRTVLAECDAAIVDVSELNDNVRWELKQCVELVGGPRIIAAYAVQPAEYPADPPRSIVDEVAEVIGEEAVSEIWFWGYPEPLQVKHRKPHLDVELELGLEDTLEQTFEEVFSAPNVSVVESSSITWNLGNMIDYIKRKIVGSIAKDMLARCTFCAKEESRGVELVKGPSVTICRECVETAMDVLSIERVEYNENICVFCGCENNEANTFIGDGRHSICNQCVEESAILMHDNGCEFTNIRIEGSA
ncbi:ClpX C4-type zinc finger protein, partial [Candidatus Saccharibacteria bacterium]|nr:ClpX C4-type zinc finger protein [Candidatus Saccharibacteria bacterium]